MIYTDLHRSTLCYICVSLCKSAAAFATRAMIYTDLHRSTLANDHSPESTCRTRVPNCVSYRQDVYWGTLMFSHITFLGLISCWPKRLMIKRMKLQRRIGEIESSSVYLRKKLGCSHHLLRKHHHLKILLILPI